MGNLKGGLSINCSRVIGPEPGPPAPPQGGCPGPPHGPLFLSRFSSADFEVFDNKHIFLSNFFKDTVLMNYFVLCWTIYRYLGSPFCYLLVLSY